MVRAAAATGAAVIVPSVLVAVVAAVQNSEDAVISAGAMIVPLKGANQSPRRLRCRKST
jgi:hypothetical protein